MVAVDEAAREEKRDAGVKSFNNKQAATSAAVEVEGNKVAEMKRAAGGTLGGAGDEGVVEREKWTVGPSNSSLIA